MDFFSFVSLYFGIAALLIAAFSITGVIHSSYHNSIDKLNFTAVTHFQQGQLAEAVECLEKALHRNPVCAHSHAILAQILCEELQTLDRALEEINTAIKLAPLTGEFYSIRGSIYISKFHQIEAGQQDLSRAEELGCSSNTINPTVSSCLIKL